MDESHELVFESHDFIFECLNFSLHRARCARSKKIQFSSAILTESEF